MEQIPSQTAGWPWHLTPEIFHEAQEDVLRILSITFSVLYVLWSLYIFSGIIVRSRCKSLRFTNIVALLLQCLIATGHITLYLEIALLQRSKFMPIFVLTSALCAVCVSFPAIWFSIPTTARGIFHLFSIVVWQLLSRFPTFHNASPSKTLPALYAAAMLADFFILPQPSSNLEPHCPGYLSNSIFGWLDSLIYPDQGVGLRGVPLPDVDGFFDYNDLKLIAHTQDLELGLFKPWWAYFISISKRSLLPTTILRLIEDAATVASPWLLRYFLQRQTNELILLMFMTRVLGSVCGNYSAFQMRMLAVRGKSILTMKLHSAALLIRSSNPLASNECVSLTEIDTQRILEATVQAHDLWSTPLKLILSVGSLTYLLGWRIMISTLPCLLLCFPILSTAIHFTGIWIQRTMNAKDRRTKLVKEALEKIKHIKLYGWEAAVQQRLDAARIEEVNTHRGTAIHNAVMASTISALPNMLTLVAFSLLTYRSGGFNAELVFPCITLFTMVNANLGKMSSLAPAIQIARNSFSRITGFLDTRAIADPTVGKTISDGVQDDVPRVLLKNVNLGRACEKPFLANVNLAVDTSDLVTISGPTGSGKTAILNVLLGALPKTRGTAIVEGSISYVPQEPWLMDGTIRENILFGRELDPIRYERALFSSCMMEDLRRLADGDQTHLGGAISLSGGQKSRICLARAVYSESDIYIFDDPLAALDVRVQRHVLNHLLGSEGLLQNKTRIIATNNLNLIAAADTMYVIKDGTLKKSEPDVLDLMCDEAELITLGEELQPTESEALTPVSTFAQETGDIESLSKFGIKIDIVEPIDLEACSLSPGPSESRTSMPDAELSKWQLFKRWAASASVYAWILVIILVMFTRISSSLSTNSLRMATEKANARDCWKALTYFGIFALLQVVGFFCFIMAVYNLCMLPAAISLHKKLVGAVIGTPMSFFETQPQSQILNRFTNDLNRLDMSLNVSIIQLVVLGTDISIILTILLWSTPLSAVFILPLILLYKSLLPPYLCASRAAKQIEVMTRAPIITTVREADAAKVIFTVFRQCAAQKQKMAGLVKSNMRHLIALMALDIWLTVRLEILSTILLALSMYSLLALNASAGLLGFVLLYTLSISGMMNNLVRFLGQFEVDLVSLRRVQEYIDLPQEHDENQKQLNLGVPQTPEVGYLTDWPSNGDIKFNTYSGRYREGLPICLSNIDLHLHAGSKTAIIGRTGAGKSSMILALLNMLDTEAGSITIDDTDISDLDPRQLRSRIAIVPQAPEVFSVTLRENLDPFGSHEDDTLMQVLEKTFVLEHLEGMVKSGRVDSDAILGLTFEDGSTSLSTGQTQLLALARAALVKSKILILDEATSGLDPLTDTTIRAVLRAEFKDYTTIAIVHSLETALEYEQILILDQGRVIAFDTPTDLLRAEDEIFIAMLREAGLLEFAKRKCNL